MGSVYPAYRPPNVCSALNANHTHLATQEELELVLSKPAPGRF